jgi:hypothetical protein
VETTDLVVSVVNHVGGNVGERIDDSARHVAILQPLGLPGPVHRVARLHSRLAEICYFKFSFFTYR